MIIVKIFKSRAGMSHCKKDLYIHTFTEKSDLVRQSLQKTEITVATKYFTY
jgi:hypothetical protein